MSAGQTIDKAKQLLFLIGLFSFIFIIIARLFYLQIYLNNSFFNRAKQNYTRKKTIASQRGNIVDYHNKLLATNRPIVMLYWKGSGNRHLNESQKTILQTLESIIPNANLDFIAAAEKRKKTIRIAEDISYDALSKIMEQFPNAPNIHIETNIKRFYPYKTTGCHILGYINSISIDQTGKMGLEKLLELKLRGSHGQTTSMINSFGTQLYEKEIKKALTGKTIQTTINITMQQMAEQSFPQNLSGSLIIIDPEDGSIQTLISRPSFNPNLFLGRISHESWHTLQEKNVFLNRAFNASYPPASIFKLVTLSAALELGIISTEDTLTCKGHISFAGRRYHCAKRIGHGKLRVKDMVAESCNILFYEIGKKINIDDLADYARRFGLGQKTNILFSESSGLVPTREWKYHRYGEPWWPGETISASIGQSYLLATPIQIARMISGIFQGYLVTPRILVDEPLGKEELFINPKTIQFLKKSMKLVVKKGTGKHLSTIDDLVIYAKTGTAQTSEWKKRFEGEQYLEHAWFVSHFRYKNEKPLVLVIVVEHTGSSRTATNIAKQFLTRYRSNLNSLHKNID